MDAREAKDKKRLTLDFDANSYELLEDLALNSGKTKAGVLRTALALYAVAQEEEKQHKNKIAVVDSKGKQIKQLIIA